MFLNVQRLGGDEALVCAHRLWRTSRWDRKGEIGVFAFRPFSPFSLSHFWLSIRSRPEDGPKQPPRNTGAYHTDG